MKKGYVFLIIIGVIVLVAILTNPGTDRHKEAVKTELNTLMQKKIKDKAGDTNAEVAGQAIGAFLDGAIIDRIVSNMVSTDNYILFSTTKITWEGQARVIGIGVFGNVYISESVKSALEQNSDN